MYMWMARTCTMWGGMLLAALLHYFGDDADGADAGADADAHAGALVWPHCEDPRSHRSGTRVYKGGNGNGIILILLPTRRSKVLR